MKPLFWSRVQGSTLETPTEENMRGNLSPLHPPKKLRRSLERNRTVSQVLGDYKILKKTKQNKKQQEYSFTTLASYYKVY